MSRTARVAPAGPADVPSLSRSLAQALAGTGPALLPSDEIGAGRHDAAGEVADGVALVVRTSGSTGAAREVLLGAAALRASATATAARLGGPGHWLLALPATHVAGLQVLVRSVLAGHEPVVQPAGAFRAEAFAAATAHLVQQAAGDRIYTSLVPTQLTRALGSPDGQEALVRYDAVLVGGAASEPGLLVRARERGVRVVTTYGMTETCGGCVYDGVPLEGVEVELAADGRVLLAGPVLADGYRGRPDLDAEVFVTHAGRRRVRTSDLGRWADGRLEILGRADDVIITGGVNVAPLAVEHAVAGLPEVAEVCVVGIPDPEWGQAVVAVVVPRPGAEPPSLEQVRAAVTRTLEPAAAPRHVVPAAALPLRGPGKPDRRAAAALAEAWLDRGGPART